MFRTRARPAPRPLRPPRCLPAWSRVQNQSSPRPATSSATTLLASVEPCSEPELAPPRDLFGHHAACQRGAVFRTRARPAPRPLRPPRCLPAWSRVQNQSSPRPATSSATTLLASVEPCSEPESSPRPATSSATTLLASVGPCSRLDLVPITASITVNTAPRWQAAWWRSNGFLGGFALVLNTVPRWRAAW